MKITREMKSKAIELGFEEIDISQRGAHWMLRATIRGRKIKYFFANTPSDWRAQRNNLAYLRRMAKGVK